MQISLSLIEPDHYFICHHKVADWLDKQSGSARMLDNSIDQKLFVGLVSFGKGNDLLEMFDSETAGAAGWIGGLANDASEFEFYVNSEMSEAGYTNIEIQDIQEIANTSEAYKFHEHLGKNMENWEPGKRTVWGYLYPFTSDE